MAEAVHMGAGGFAVPPIPAEASNVNERPGVPPASALNPGFVPPAPQAQAPAGGFTQADIDAAVAAALAGKQAAPAPAPAAPAPALNPAAAINTPAELTTANDPLLTSMTTMLTSAVPGLDLSRALGNALALGDARLIDRAYINEVGGANAAHLTALAEGIIQRVEYQAAEGARAVHTIAGGEQQWNTAAAVFNASAPAHQKLVIKQMLDSGNTEAIQAAAQSVVEFAKSSGKVPVAPGLVQAGASALGAAQALDKVGFQAELRKLNPREPGYEAARAELFARRSAGKSLGM